MYGSRPIKHSSGIDIDSITGPHGFLGAPFYSIFILKFHHTPN